MQQSLSLKYERDADLSHSFRKFEETLLDRAMHPGAEWQLNQRRKGREADASSSKGS